ncbi:MAG: branched-chain amino acid ABC transporter permease [Gammaproteobacteria bacterium]|nr:branched-chain amino acid ABC transporter permease [Gammaproteobacteria bacterium]MBU1443390.1 branched-chain amino acid ABC transporter permease [Gammaproteobacteria bacterium]MBU2286644.1 branched-chain amino acid ABC transporter permease [Gammaproteobacteria bacterium]MBU2409124.1 branched-chain amino acid ABC transporter permease [Gammaproteobacteria bacterium]
MTPALQGISRWVPLAVAVALAVLGPMLGAYVSDLVVKVMILAILALSLELLVGMTGLVSLGHAAFYGIGAYATVMASGRDGGSIGWLLPLAMGSAAGYALLVGALSLRTRGVYFIMVTLAFAQMAFFLFHDTDFGGGSDGIYMYIRPVLGPIDLEGRNTLFYFVLAALVLTYAFLALLRRSRFGAALAGIRVNEQRMRAAGFPVYGYKLAAFVIAGALAGLAGFLVASRDGVVNPELMAWHISGEILLMIILGGLGHLRGAVIGATAFTLLKELLSTHALVGPMADHWQLSLGLAIIVFVALLPRGIIGIASRLGGKAAA